MGERGGKTAGATSSPVDKAMASGPGIAEGRRATASGRGGRAERWPVGGQHEPAPAGPSQAGLVVAAPGHIDLYRSSPGSLQMWQACGSGRQQLAEVSTSPHHWATGRAVTVPARG